MVADEVRVEVLHEGKGTVVDGDTKDAQVIGVKHPVAEAVALPESNQFCCVSNYLDEHVFVAQG